MAYDDALIVFQTGVTITTSGTSARVAMGNTSAGALPRFVRIAATAAAYVKFGDNTVTASAGDLLVQPADAVVLAVPKGATNVAAIQVSSAGVVQISSLEN